MPWPTILTLSASHHGMTRPFSTTSTQCKHASRASAHSPASAACRLLDFVVSDENGVAQPLSNLDLVKGPLYFSGMVHPAEGAISKSGGRRLAQSGQLRGWRVHFTGPELQVRTRLVPLLRAAAAGMAAPAGCLLCC